MDISMNLIDLQYLTNPVEFQKLQHKTKNPDILSVNDLKFYKKRLFQLTKNILQGENVDKKIQHSFEQYANVVIEHFKFMDKIDIIQKEYIDIKEKKCNVQNIDMQKTNDLIFKKSKPHRPKITDHINIKSTKTIRPIIIPKKKDINLKDPKFRIKGLIKKKNITN
jgi:hypothetical protein